MGITNAEHRNYKTLGEEIEQETTQTAVPCLSRDATTTRMQATAADTAAAR